jgi:hypothetical protein
MSSINAPSEFMHCFNIIDEIPALDQMEIEEPQQLDLYEAASLEWHVWQPSVDDQVKKNQKNQKLKELWIWICMKQILTRNRQ